MTVRFIVDEKSISLHGLSTSDGLEVIEDLLDLIEDSQREGHDTCFDDELFNINLLGQRSFWELCDPDSPIYLTPEVSERAATIFGRLPRWHELDEPWPPDFDVSVGGGFIETTPSVAWAHQQAVKGGLSSVACICGSGGRRSGAVAVELAGRSENVWFVASAADMEHYFRWLIVEYATTSDDIEELATCAFRKLTFVDRCFEGIRTMSKPCRMLAPMIVHHLAAFSDDGQRIFAGPWIRAPQEFGALGINISDENGATKRNHQARNERRIVVNNEELLFWWHSKIEPHRDRIHVYPNKVTQGGNIIVGIFCQHLTV